MKSCPTCNRTYTDASLNFCLEDGTPLTLSAPPATPGFDPNATIRYTDARDTKPPQPEIPRPTPPVPQATYHPSQPVASHGSAFGQQQGSALPVPGPQPKKSNAVWWILGGVVVLGVIAVGAVVMILALASMGSNANSNGNANRANANARNANRNANANTANANSNASPKLPAVLTDDFSQAKWGTGNYAFGDIWYADDQYHMRAKAKTYLVMYAPPDYNTANATVRVTARSVDGTPALTGYGLIIHGEKSKTGQLEDYALLIDTSTEPRYQIIKHKGGTQSAVVPWVKSTVIRTGTNPNQLEIRAKGADLSFYINGQYVDRITDNENFKSGVAGLYTSDIAEVAFDDLEIKR